MPSAHRDPALDALLHPFASGLLHGPEGCLFLRAREGAALCAQGLRGLAATQPFRPEAARLQRLGIELLDEDALPARQFPLVLVLPPRQREEARALLARACAAVASGGRVVIAAANDEGGKSREAELKQLAGAVSTLSKHHCRVCWTTGDVPADPALQAQWAQADAPRWQPCGDVPGGGFHTRPGVFAWDRVDAASALLAAALPAGLRGRVADLGAGWGYLSLQVLARCPQVTALEMFEADARALALAEANLAAPARAHGVALRLHWHDVAAGVAGPFDAIVCNPPFHALGRGERPDIGRAFIAAAAQALRPGGALWLVANRHLPYEEALGSAFGQVDAVAQQGGFKIVRAVKA
ncbi:methyltransferase [Thermomonas sp. S9]|uniref:class I SAM-dependent methyltransferase n=1 Tax=Thermomonas sp. S9 TaxID=2885203 RepID=UPI00216AD272|nr:methyltransferase [Thermomonas sp. S9]MCR6495484.1 methyltransferase [Thermomonas sp. S9]